MTSSTPLPPDKKLRLSRQSIVVALVTLLLHVIVLQSGTWQDWQAIKHTGDEKIVQISVLPASEESPAAPAEMPKAAVKVPANVAKKPIEIAAAAADTAPPIVDQNAPVIDAEPTGAMADPSPTQASANNDELTAATSTQDPLTFPINVPASAQLNMQIIRIEANRKPTYGVGTINWEVTGNKYSMSIEAGIDMLITSINLYKLTSEGSIDTYGIAPDISTETRLTRAKTATHFHKEEKNITFSSSTNTVAMNNGAQDKASFLMQLAGIGNADASQFSPGREIILQVAEEKEASLFQFLVVNEEEITTKLGQIMVWHLVRAPRLGSYNSRLDIWLAPSFGWYPVQIRNTESNGTVTTQTVTKIIQKINMER